MKTVEITVAQLTPVLRAMNRMIADNRVPDEVWTHVREGQLELIAWTGASVVAVPLGAVSWELAAAKSSGKQWLKCLPRKGNVTLEFDDVRMLVHPLTGPALHLPRELSDVRPPSLEPMATSTAQRITVSASRLLGILDTLVPMVSKDASRHSMNSLHVMQTDTAVVVQVTDGHRLAEVELPLIAATGLDARMLIPLQYVRMLQLILTIAGKALVTLTAVDKTTFEVEAGRSFMRGTSVAIVEKYPRFDDVWHRIDAGVVVQMNPDELTAVMRTMIPVVAADAGIDFEVTERGVTVSVPASNSGGTEPVTMEAVVTGEPGMILRFNPRYIVEGCGVFHDCSSVPFRFDPTRLMLLIKMPGRRLGLMAMRR